MMKTTTSLVALCGIFAASSSGCAQETRCKELGSCGGDIPIGSWELDQQHVSCSEPLQVTTPDNRLSGSVRVPAARVPATEPALFDWCTGLLTTSGAKSIKSEAPFIYTDPRIGSATIRFDAQGGYSVGITELGTYQFDFPALCMREFGAMDNMVPPEDTENLAPRSLCKQLEFYQYMSGIGNGAYPNTVCDDNAADPGGCICTYDSRGTGGGAGVFTKIDDHTLLLIQGTAFPQRVTYCHKGDTLELTGGEGEYLFDRAGLRTLNLVKRPDPPAATQ